MNEKIYQFNEYVLGYDKDNKDRSCLTISKMQNGNMYVMSSLYDGSAEVLSLILDNLQSKIDKANQYLEERFIFDDENGEYYQTHTFDKSNAKELHDILKVE